MGAREAHASEVLAQAQVGFLKNEFWAASGQLLDSF
jgi:hypothetical protein